MTSDSHLPETTRLENLWGGQFGDDYVERNAHAGDVRQAFWQDMQRKFPAKRVLEVGCNIGGNLRWFAPSLAHHEIYGIDINQKAIATLRQQFPLMSALYSPAREIPFRDGWFDFTFTMGVLIHQPDSTLPLVMSEIVRCSRKYVLCGEYYAEMRTEVPYRGQEGALIKRDFGGMYRDLFPQLTLLESGFLGRDQGWDDVTYWVFEKA
jgi:pseudaminic acid biosynthesis-associated methylase